MYTEIQTAVESVKVISNILQASKDLRNFNELASAVSELNIKFLSALNEALTSAEKVSALNEEIRSLKEKLMKLENWEAESKDYVLKDIGPGIFAYIYKPSVDIGKPRHWACTKCFGNRNIGILQRQYPPAYKCDVCGTVIDPIYGGKLVGIDDVY